MSKEPIISQKTQDEILDLVGQNKLYEAIALTDKAMGKPDMPPWEHHPLSKRTRMMNPEELAGLKSDMKQRGQMAPGVLYRDKDDVWKLIDGRNRQEAWIQLERPINLFKVVKIDFKDDFSAKAFERASNSHRRHETLEDKKKDALEKLIESRFTFSDLSIAHIVGLSDKTVAQIRAEYEGHSENPNDETRVDKNGNKSPARKPRKSKSKKSTRAAAQQAPAQPQVAQTASSFDDLLGQHLRTATKEELFELSDRIETELFDRFGIDVTSTFIPN